MGKLIFAAVILVLGIVGWKALKIMAAKAIDPRKLRFARGLSMGSYASLVVGLLIPALIVIFSTFVIISTGHVGVVTQFSKVEPTPLYEGFNLVAPWKAVNQMSVQIKKKEGKYDSGTKDLQSVHVIMVTNYRLQAQAAPEIFRTVGYDYESVIVSPAEQEVLKAHTARFPASDILHERAKLKGDVQEDLAKWLRKYGVELKEVSLANIGFDKGYMAAIEAKQVEEQKAGQKIYELAQAKTSAEIMQASAKGAADAVREAAKGEAEALRTKGSAQAEYNSKVSASLTPQLVAQQWINAWQAGGSQVPHLMSSGQGGGGFLMQVPLPDLKKQPVEK